MQYLIKTITHDTGEVFHDVVKARENELFTLVDAESEDEAERITLLSSDKNKESIGKLMKIQRMLG